MISNILVQYGAVAFPLAIIMAIFGFENMKGLALDGVMVLSILMLSFGAYAFKVAMGKAQREENAETLQREALLRVLLRLEQRLDVLGVKNERNDSNNRNSNL